MASPQLPNYLRAYRKRLGLSQKDIAYLLGVQSAAKICRYERFLREPSLETILALELIFQKPAYELFGGPHQKIERDIVERAKILSRKISNAKSDPARERKLQTLKAIISNSSQKS